MIVQEEKQLGLLGHTGVPGEVGQVQEEVWLLLLQLIRPTKTPAASCAASCSAPRCLGKSGSSASFVISGRMRLALTGLRSTLVTCVAKNRNKNNNLA